MLVGGALLSAPVWAQVQPLYDQALQAQRVGDAELSRALLEEVVRLDPLHAGAWVDLALLTCHNAASAQARNLADWLDQHYAPPAALRNLLRQVLLTQDCEAPTPTRPRWHVRLSRGQTSNVNLGPQANDVTDTLGSGVRLTDNSLPQDDTHTTVQVHGHWPLKTNGWLQASLQRRRHDRLSAFDSDDANLQAGADLQLGNWWTQWSSGLEWTTLNGALYRQQLWGMAQAQREIDSAAHWALQLSAKQQWVHYPGLETFDTQVHLLDANLKSHHGSVQGQAGLGWIVDVGQTARPDGQRTGMHLDFSLTQRLADWDWGWSGSLTRLHSQSAYLPLFDPAPRTQRLLSQRLSVQHRLSTQTTLALDWSATHNSENLPLLNYTTQTWQVSLIWSP